MKIQVVSSNQQTCKGYVDKSFTNYVHKACKNECMNILERANKCEKKVDVKEIFDLKSLADSILSKFSKYMNYLEQHTNINISNGSVNLNNSISRGGLTFTRPMLVEKKTYITGQKIVSPAMYNNSFFLNSKEKAGRKELNLLDKMADDLKNIDYEEVDKSFLKFAELELKIYTEENGANFLKRFKSRNIAKKIDNYAQRIDQEPVNTVRVEEYIRKAKELKIIEEQEKLEIEQMKNDNIKIVNDILTQK